MVLNIKTRDLLRDFRKYRKKLQSGEVDKIVVEGIRNTKSLEIKIAIEGKTPAQQALDYCKSLGSASRVERVNLNIFDNFIKD